MVYSGLTMNILDKEYTKASDRLTFMVEEVTRLTTLLRGNFVCAECGEDTAPQLTPTHRVQLSKEFRELCKDIRIEVEDIAGATDPDAAVRAALANKNLPEHVRASILAAQEGTLQDEPEGAQ